jgi:hypothetical protein
MAEMRTHGMGMTSAPLVRLPGKCILIVPGKMWKFSSFIQFKIMKWESLIKKITKQFHAYVLSTYFHRPDSIHSQLMEQSLFDFIMPCCEYRIFTRGPKTYIPVNICISFYFVFLCNCLSIFATVISSLHEGMNESAKLSKGSYHKYT